jgi:LacI family transcriptional regulator
MPARATMNDVARLAGVSLKTVSRVVNGEPGVREDTAVRVQRAVAELRFERNDLARSLRQGAGSSTLGLVIEDLANPFYSAIAQAVEEVARERGYLLISASAREDPQRERELVTALLRRRVDALLVVPAGPDHRYIVGSGSATKMVFLDRPPAKVEADTVLLDNAAGARRGVAHLLEHGHTQVAFVGDDPGLFTARERLSGYRRALKAAGLQLRDELISVGNRSAADAERAVQRLLALAPRTRPTAIFAANNRASVGALHVLGGGQRRIALVGFDELELGALVGLTVVRSDPSRMGQRAAELAFARIAGDDAPPRRVFVRTELVPRGSGEVAA